MRHYYYVAIVVVVLITFEVGQPWRACGALLGFSASVQEDLAVHGVGGRDVLLAAAEQAAEEAG